eukprot:8137937-Pyramimonas_sp.AAC.1
MPNACSTSPTRARMSDPSSPSGDPCGRLILPATKPPGMNALTQVRQHLGGLGRPLCGGSIPIPMCVRAATPTPELRPPPSVMNEGWRQAFQPDFLTLASPSVLDLASRVSSCSITTEASVSLSKYRSIERHEVVLHVSSLKVALPLRDPPGLDLTGSGWKTGVGTGFNLEDGSETCSKSGSTRGLWWLNRGPLVQDSNPRRPTEI